MTNAGSGRKDALWRALISLTAAVLAFMWVSSDAAEVGLTWDEPPYFASAVRIQDWAAELIKGPDRASVVSAERIEEVWNWGRTWNPHPPVYKEAMALTGWIAGDRLGSARGFRLAPLLFFCILIGAVAWVGSKEWGPVGGSVAAAALLLMPRVLGHAHIAATDVPVTALWFLATIGTVRFIEHRYFGAFVLAFITFGLAISTKFTGLLILAPIIAWALVYRRRINTATAILAVGAAALIVAYLANPLLWHDPAEALWELVNESVTRGDVVPIATYYFGTSYAFELPWHHAIAMTLVTVPIGILVLGLWGAGSALPKLRREALSGLCFVEVVFFWTLLALPNSPNHDGVRLFLPMFPFLALLAGRGAAEVGRLLRRRLSGAELGLVSASGAIVFLMPAYLQTVAISPYYLSYYNELIGGVRGAEQRGMEMTYWYDALTPAFFERLNEILPPDAELATFPSQDYFLALQGLGLLRGDVRIHDTLPAQYYLIYGRRGMFTPIEWEIYRNVQPLLAVELEGVELAGLYQYQPPSPAEGSGDPGPREAESD